MKSNEISKNGGRGMIEKIISSFLVATVVISSSISLMGSSLDNSYFTFTRNASQTYNVSLNPSANFSSISEVPFPSTYNNGSSEVGVVFTSASLNNNTTINSVSIPTVTTGSDDAFRGLNSLNEVKYTYSGSGDLTFSNIVFSNCSTTLNKIYISANSVLFSSSGSSAFTNFINNKDSKIIVTSNDVKQQIIIGTKSGVPVSENKIEVVESQLPKPTIDLTCENIKFHTEGGFKPKATVSLDGKAMDPQPTVEYTLFLDEACTQKFGHSYDYNAISPGKYYLRASIATTDTYQGAKAVIPVEVLPLSDKAKLQEAVEKADEILGNVEELGKYTDKSVERLRVTVRDIKDIRRLLSDNNATQEDVDAATEAIENAITYLTEKDGLADGAKLSEFNDAINTYGNVNSLDYTEESYAAFKEVLDEMKDIQKEVYPEVSAELVDDILARIKDAYDKLEKAPITFADLEKAVADADEYLNDASQKSKYTEESWKALEEARAAGQKLLDDKESVSDNATIRTAISRIRNAINGLVLTGNQDAYAELLKVIEEAKSYSANANSYTTSSYQALQDALSALYRQTGVSEVLKLTPTSKLEDIEAAIKSLREAIEGLKNVEGYVASGGPISYIRYGYHSNNVISGTYDGKAKATKVRFTFDCASDANFSPYSSIELQANVNGSQIAYEKVRGKKATEENGSKNATAVLDLSSNPIEVGQSYELYAYTYSNQGASDYIYAITKIEFLDDEGNVLKAFNDVTAAKENLKKSVEAAKALDESKYTEDSYKKVVDAISEAEKVIENENATKNEVDAAAAALTEAIRGLTEKQQPASQNPSGSGNNTVKPTTPTTAAPKKRSNADVQKDRQAAVRKMNAAKITKLKVKSKAKKKITVTWKKVKSAKGYEVQVSTSKKFKKSKIIFKKLTTKKTLKISNKKIKSGKTYYVRVRAYTTYNNINGKPQKAYSKWNKKLRTVKVK